MEVDKKIFLPLARKHCMKAAEWGHTMATDYWLQFNSGLDTLAAANTATGDELAENGWVSTSLVNTAGSANTFGTYVPATGIPNHALTNASADLLSSPAIFGDYAHMVAAAQIVGKRHTDLPRFLVADFWGSMSVFSANEPRSNWGFIVAGGSPATEANQYSCISVGAANFQLGISTVYTTGTIVADANWRFFRIKIDRVSQTTHWYILNSTTKVMDQMPDSGAITATGAPLKWGFHALTTNRPLLGPTHIYYDW